MRTELTIFRVKPGKEARADEWMRTLVARRDECLATLGREAMYYESLFRLSVDGRMHLGWFTAQGDVHDDVDESDHDIDKVHCAFFDECLEVADPRPMDFDHVVTFAPEPIERAITDLDRES